MEKNSKIKIFLKSLLIFVEWLGPLTAFLFVYLVVAGQPINSLFASQANINVSVTAVPDNPIQQTEPATAAAIQANTSTFISPEYTFIAPLKNGQTGAATTDLAVTAPLTTLTGVVAFPYSKTVLEISPEHFYVTVSADAYGRWSWTNYGSPLSTGPHMVTVYNFSPIGQPEGRNVFIAAHRFAVADVGTTKPPALLELNEKTTDPSLDVELLREHFTSGGREKIHFFEVSLQNSQTSYQIGADVPIRMNIAPVKAGQPAETALKFELFFLAGDGAQYKLAGGFEDNLPEDMGTFAKTFSIKHNISSGEYLLKTTARIGDSVYVQAVPFAVAPAKFVTIGGVAVRKSDIKRVILWNVMFALFVLGFILTLIINEFRRLIDSPQVDEDTLKARDYL